MDPAASAGGPADEPANLRWLRSLNALTKTAWAICTWCGFGIFTIVVPPVFVVVVFLFAFSLFLIALARVAYLAILFFCHSRYSLRTLLTVVLVLGLGLSCVVSGSPVLQVVGGLMLYALVMEILFGIQAFDPLGEGTEIPGKDVKARVAAPLTGQGS
jgi:hypothetical protein